MSAPRTAPAAGRSPPVPRCAEAARRWSSHLRFGTMASEPERPAAQGYYPHVMAGEEVPSVSGEPPPRKRRRRRRRPKPAAAAGAGSGTSSGTPAKRTDKTKAEQRNQRAASKGGAAKKTKASGASKKKRSEE